LDTIVVYSAQKSTRLHYVLDWLFKEQLHVDYKLVQNEKDLDDLSFFISYGKSFPNALSIPDAGLLWHQGIKKYEIITGTWNNIPTLCAIDADEEKSFSLPFDILSAIFFLLSRYEEYYPFKADAHGRYPAKESILYKMGWLREPLIDEWIEGLMIMLKERFNTHLSPLSFSYQPTYDIDIAYSYLHKGRRRTVGGYAKDLLSGNIKSVKERYRVLHGEKDPYDTFFAIQELHKLYNIKPIFFILMAPSATNYDKNINPTHPEMQKLIKRLSHNAWIGIHPSYYTDRNNELPAEKKILEETIGKNISISRQHYIKLKLPDTYRELIGHGITSDYSMGYGTHLGFRAGTGRSFLWYDVLNEAITGLRIYPFCFMDTTAWYGEKLNAADALSALREMTKKLQQTHSTLITIFHNFSLGTSSEWVGWGKMYELFLGEMFKK